MKKILMMLMLIPAIVMANTNSTVYIAIDAGVSHLGKDAGEMCQFLTNVSNMASTSGQSSCSNHTPIDIALGYNFNNYSGVEIKAASVGGKTFKYSTQYDGINYDANADLNIQSLELAGIGYFPIVDNFRLTGKLGFALTEVSTKGSIQQHNPDKTVSELCIGCSFEKMNYVPIYGVGMQYDFSRLIGMRMNYEHYGNMSGPYDTKIGASTYTAGVLLKF